VSRLGDVERVAKLVCDERVRSTVAAVVPFWPEKPWFAQLQRAAEDHDTVDMYMLDPALDLYQLRGSTIGKPTRASVLVVRRGAAQLTEVDAPERGAIVEDESPELGAGGASADVDARSVVEESGARPEEQSRVRARRSRAADGESDGYTRQRKRRVRAPGELWKAYNVRACLSPALAHS